MEGSNMDLQCPEFKNFYDVPKRAIFRRVRKIAKSDYEHRHVCLSVRPNGTTRLPLDEFSLSLILEFFSPENLYGEFVSLQFDTNKGYVT
jgi:hypothetical protein